MYNNLFLTIVILFVTYFIYKTFYNNTIIETLDATKIATESDSKRAMKYALEKRCKNKGYFWFQGADEFVFDCKHTKTSCSKDSVYPTKEGVIPSYLEWREFGSEDANLAGYLGAQKTNDMTSILSAQPSIGISSNITTKFDNKELGGVCIIGNEEFRKFCENEGLRYDITNGQCYTTQPYCAKRGMPFCNGDCFDDPSLMINKAILGDTLGTILSVASPSYLITQAACAIDTESKKKK